MHRKDLTGKKFSRLTVLYPDTRSKAGKLRWRCLCDCGKEITVQTSNLTTGHTTSCGCYQQEKRYTNNRKHGYRWINGKPHPIYSCWLHIKERCYNPKYKRYKDYGGRGIKVCDRWLGELGFHNFLIDMRDSWKPGLTIERKDVNGNYDPINCIWDTWDRQARNKRSNIYLTFQGKTLCMAEWSRKTGIGEGTIRWRKKKGWSDEKVLTTPVRKKRQD